MIIEASGITLPLEAGLSDGQGCIEQAVVEALGIDKDQIASVKMLRRSIDARKKMVRFIATLAIDCPAIHDVSQLNVAKGVHVQSYIPPEPLNIPLCSLSDGQPRPIVVGTGPAGLFAALYLAGAGLKPLVLERGGSVDERIRAIDSFNAGANLDLQTNIQFGEGGAGTFSDGKLTTGTKSPLQRDVLNWFVQAGAPEEILVLAKPHIGTDNLRQVVKNLRRAIEEAGGTVVFHSQLHDICLDEAGKLAGVVVKVMTELAYDQLLKSSPLATVQPCDTVSAKGAAFITLPAQKLILSCGHSARDTFKMLQRHQVLMEQKPFSVGVRIEHLQSDIDRAQYGLYAGHPALGAADYKMSVHLPDGRSVYTFCMCPGGQVVAAASEEYGVAVNGMSQFARDGVNANAALLVNVEPADFPSSDPLAGLTFQRRIEQEAFGEAHELGGEAWSAPVQTVGDFLAKTAGNPSKGIIPTYARGVVWCDLREVLPPFVYGALEQALPLFEKKLKGFANPDAVMTGVETRSSSPVRIVRDNTTLQAKRGVVKKIRARDKARGHDAAPQILSENIGLYPCGEGAGYAGGIMSAAVDGLRCAQALASSYGSIQSAVNDTCDINSVSSFLDPVIPMAIDALKRGEAIVFPTDTVYGLGVSVLHAQSPQLLFDLKERDQGKPVAWLIGSIDDLRKYGKNVSDEVLALVKKQWPGALTIIVEASDEVPKAYQSGEGTIGLRMPDNALVCELIQKVGSPLATTSANFSGQSATNLLDEIDTRLLEKVSVVLQDDTAGKGSASTVIDYSKGQPVSLRS